MRYITRPTDNTALCEPVTASLKGWLVRLIVWFCEVLDAIPQDARRWPLVREFISASKARVARDLRTGVYTLGQILILQGYVRMNFAPRRLRQRRFGPAARRSSNMRRRLTRVVAGMNAGSLRQRAERLAAALDNLEPLSARMLNHMRALWRYVRSPALIPAPVSDKLISSSAPLTPAHADTS